MVDVREDVTGSKLAGSWWCLAADERLQHVVVDSEPLASFCVARRPVDASSQPRWVHQAEVILHAQQNGSLTGAPDYALPDPRSDADAFNVVHFFQVLLVESTQEVENFVENLNVLLIRIHRLVCHAILQDCDHLVLKLMNTVLDPCAVAEKQLIRLLLVFGSEIVEKLLNSRFDCPFVSLHYASFLLQVRLTCNTSQEDAEY